MTSLKTSVIDPGASCPNDIEICDIDLGIWCIEYTICMCSLGRIPVVAPFAADISRRNMLHMTTIWRASVRHRRIKCRRKTRIVTICTGSRGCPGIRAVPEKRPGAVAGDSRTSPRCRVPCTGGANDVHIDQSRVTAIESPVHVRRGVYIVVMAPFAGDPPLLNVLDMFSVRPCSISDQRVWRCRTR